MALSKQKNAAKNQDAGELNVSPNLHVGDLLRQNREGHGLTVDMVADELMIRRFYLDALEAGSFKDLPERVYAIGFVRNYAKYLGIDVDAIVEQFKKEAYGARTGGSYQTDLSMPEPVSHSVVPGRSAILSAVVVLALVIAGIVFMTRSGDRNNVTTIPAPDMVGDNAAAGTAAPRATTPATATTPNTATGEATSFAAAPTTAESAAPAAASVPPAPASQNHRVLEALQASWVEVKDDKGVILFSSILKTGQLLPLPDGKRMAVTTGNAGGLRLVVDGQAQAPFGAVNEVKRGIPVPVEAPAAAIAAPRR